MTIFDGYLNPCRGHRSTNLRNTINSRQLLWFRFVPVVSRLFCAQESSFPSGSLKREIACDLLANGTTVKIFAGKTEEKLNEKRTKRHSAVPHFLLARLEALRIHQQLSDSKGIESITFKGRTTRKTLNFLAPSTSMYIL